MPKFLEVGAYVGSVVQFGGPPPTTFYNPDGSRTPAPDGNGGAAASGAQRALDHETIEYRVSEIDQKSGSRQSLFAEQRNAAVPVVFYVRSGRNMDDNMDRVVDTVESFEESRIYYNSFGAPQLMTSISRLASSAALDLVSGRDEVVTRWEFTSDPLETSDVPRISRDA